MSPPPTSGPLPKALLLVAVVALVTLCCLGFGASVVTLP